MKWISDRAVSLFTLLAAASIASSCQRTPDSMWNDTKTAGRHVSRGVNTIGGKGGDSRQVASAEEFGADGSQSNVPNHQDDFIAFDDEPQGRLNMGEAQSVPQPRQTPGELGSSIPGIDAFKDPAQDPNLAPIFEHVHFEYNSSLVKGDESIAIIQKIADFMKSHPSMYLFVEGHCDQRGPAAYNFALGANRANAVRNMLIQEGISPDRVFTISYGKEKPLFQEEGEDYYRLNRRAQFKVWEG